MVQTMERSSLLLMQRERDVDKQGGDSERVVQAMIVDTHLLIREALQRVIGGFPQVRIYASLSQIQEVLATLKKGQGDVLILGSSLAASSCLEYVKAARQVQPSLGIVVIQQRLYPETTFPLMRGGVQSLLGEDASTQDLERAITAAASGNTFLGQRAREILDGYVSRIPLHFTEREMQILPLLRLGLSNFCIAQKLGLKEKTVEKHLTHIYEKLHIRSRTEAILCMQTLHI